MTSNGSDRAQHEQEKGTDERALELIDQPFTDRDLHTLRHAVAAHASDLLSDDRVDDLALIAVELASNAILHGGGHGRLRLWSTASALYCQVTDDGPGLPDSKYPAVQPPEASASAGRGLWLALHFSDALTVDNQVDGGATITAMINLASPADDNHLA